MTTPEAPPSADPAVTTCFGVSIDKLGLGSFSSCEGLGLEVVIEQREEGGSNGFVWQLPTRIKYSNIKLSRGVCKDTAAIAQWIAEVARGTKPKTATIAAMTADGKTVASWDLIGVVPVRWTGPSLNPDSPKVATETVEIAHHGFLHTPASAVNSHGQN
jgi:phage tail-like protein